MNTEVDLCEQVSNVDLSCPIKKGKTVIVKDVALPKEIPPVRPPSRLASFLFQYGSWGWAKG